MLQCLWQPCPGTVHTQQKLNARIASVVGGGKQRGFVAVMKSALERHVCTMLENQLAQDDQLSSCSGCDRCT